MATVEKLLRLNREKRRDFNLTHLVERLHSEEGIGLSCNWMISHLPPGDAYYQ